MSNFNLFVQAVSVIILVCTAGLVERDVHWAAKAREHAQTKAQEQLNLMGKVSTEVQSLQQVKWALLISSLF